MMWDRELRARDQQLVDVSVPRKAEVPKPAVVLKLPTPLQGERAERPTLSVNSLARLGRALLGLKSL